MKLWSDSRSVLRHEPRFWVPVVFLVAAVVLVVIALTIKDDEGASFGWLGVCSAFLTAGLVDLFGLLEGRRRRIEQEQQLAPIRATILRDLQWQRRDLLTSVRTLFDVSGEAEEWPKQLRDNNWPMVAGDQANVSPPQTKAGYLTGVYLQMRERQLHLEGLAAGGLLATEVAAMSEIVLRGSWQSLLGVLQTQVGYAMTGTTTLAADMVERLMFIDIT